MEVAKLTERLKAGNPAGWYLFAGEEEYLKKFYRKMISDAVLTDPVFETMNHTVFDGQTVKIAEIRDALEVPPMMADFKLVEWRYPGIYQMRESDRKAFFDLLEQKDLYPYSVFVVSLSAEECDLGSEKRPSKERRELEQFFDLLVFEKSTDTQLLSWLKKHFDAEGISADRRSLEALIFRSGHGMETLSHEVEKLSAFMKANGRSILDAETVAAVASPTLESDAFALSNAISDKSREKAFAALEDMKQRRIDPLAILGSLAKTYGEIVSVSLLLDEGQSADAIEKIMKFGSPYRTKMVILAAKKQTPARLLAALDSLCKSDIAAKSGTNNGYGIIERFLAENL